MARAKHVKITRDEVARKAHVSTATVSRVYNAPERVSPDKVARVHAAAQALGYMPNKSASALRRTGTGFITLLEGPGRAAYRDDRIYNWFYSDMMRGIRLALDASMYQLNLVTYRTAKDKYALSHHGLGDGVILHEPAKDVLDVIRQQKRPYVCCGQTELPPGIQACYTDNVQGGGAAARAFLESGHKRPAHISANLSSMNVCRLRWEGFRQGYAGTEVRVVDGELSVRGGYASAQTLIPAIRKKEVDCIFVVNDLTAVGVARALMDAGLRIPQQVSIIGYDNLPFLEVLPIRLATIDIAYGEVYRRATACLLQRLRTGGSIHEIVQPVYVAGKSVQRR